jgi:hypothetical protein
VSGVLLPAVAVVTTDGWPLVALLVLSASVVGTGFAGRRWAHRRTRTRGKDLPGRVRLRRTATAGALAAAVALPRGAGRTR